MAFSNTPGAKERAPRRGTPLRGGDLAPPDFKGSGKTASARGKYPADGSFLDTPRDTRKGGPSGDPMEITAPTSTYQRLAPSKSPRANNTTNPIK